MPPLKTNVIYEATISYAEEIENFIGSTGKTFLGRWYSHNKSFKMYKDNGTELAKYGILSKSTRSKSDR